MQRGVDQYVMNLKDCVSYVDLPCYWPLYGYSIRTTCVSETRARHYMRDKKIASVLTQEASHEMDISFSIITIVFTYIGVNK